MRLFRMPTAVMLKLVLLVTLTLPLTAFDKCENTSRAQIVTLAKNAVADARDILPIFASVGLANTHVTNAIGIGDRLVQAFEKNQDGDAIELAASFIDATNEIVSVTDTFKDKSKQTWALAIIAGLRITLRRISSYLKPAEDAGVLRGAGAPGTRSAASKVREFAKSSEWRCRSSQTGRFQKMSYCREHPDVSVVERR